MNGIKIKVDDSKLQIVLTILENLKEGLIEEIIVNGKSSSVKSAQYKPRVNIIIKEEESGTRDTSGKYATASIYKQRLQKKK